jgi:flagellar motor switch protein FliG
MYGKDNSIEDISISLFDKPESYYSESQNNAKEYCKNINDLELTNNQWIHASIIGENEKVFLKIPPKFDVLLKIDDLGVQKLLRDISTSDLAKALKGADEEIIEKVFKNMTKRSVVMLKENMEGLGQVSIDDIRTSRNKIIDALKHLESTGEIVVLV